MTLQHPTARLILFGVCTLLAGCQTYSISEKSDHALEYVQTEIHIGRNAVTNATGALENIRDSKRDDLPASIIAYHVALKQLDDKSGGVGLVLNTAESGANKRFASWQKSIDDIADDDLRQEATERKAEVMRRYNDVNDRIEKLRIEFKPFMAKLQDISKTVGADTSTAGRDIASGAIKDVLSQRDAILKDIDELDHAVSKLRGK